MANETILTTEKRIEQLRGEINLTPEAAATVAEIEATLNGSITIPVGETLPLAGDDVILKPLSENPNLVQTDPLTRLAQIRAKRAKELAVRLAMALRGL